MPLTPIGTAPLKREYRPKPYELNIKLRRFDRKFVVWQHLPVDKHNWAWQPIAICYTAEEVQKAHDEAAARRAPLKAA